MIHLEPLQHDPDKEHFMHQKPQNLDEEHFGSQTLTPKLPNQNRNTKTLRKESGALELFTSALVSSSHALVT